MATATMDSSSAPPVPATGDAGDDYNYHLGSYSHKVTTESAAAQRWFDRGLIWSYGFNHEEAVHCFDQATSNDPSCTMGYWGVAFALGPNYNKPWELYDPMDLENTLKRASEAIAKGKEVASHPLETALLEALEPRYNVDKQPKARNQAYSDAMSSVYSKYGSDPDVAALYAESIMDIKPWALWNLKTGEPGDGAPDPCKVKTILDQALESHPHHPGLLHLYIHLMEMSQTPELALTAADKLIGSCPDSGHLEHMSSHIDVLCGNYIRAVQANESAMRADQKFVQDRGIFNFYSLYRIHDLHFRIYAAMCAGQKQKALETVEKLEEAIPEQLLLMESPPMVNWLETLFSIRVHVLIRFGLWNEVLNLPLPNNQELYCYTTAMLHYAKGVSHAALGQIPEAEQEQANFAKLHVNPKRMLFNNPAPDILKIAEAMLAGEIEYRKHRTFDGLRRAVDLCDNLTYNEPWGWMQPPRHALGALLLEQGQLEEAAAVYAADLGVGPADSTEGPGGRLPRALQHPLNVWSLHGYSEALGKLGRENGLVTQELRIRMAQTDVKIRSSCYCRNGKVVEAKL